MKAHQIRQMKFIMLHAIVLSNLTGRVVSINEAGIDWSHNLAVEYRQRHP